MVHTNSLQKNLQSKYESFLPAKRLFEQGYDDGYDFLKESS